MTIAQNSLSAAPDSTAGVARHALPARSVGVVDGVQVIVELLPAVCVPAPLGVPSVTVIVEPLIIIVEPVKLTFALV